MREGDFVVSLEAGRGNSNFLLELSAGFSLGLELEWVKSQPLAGFLEEQCQQI